MRTIKFRAKNYNGEWLFGYLMPTNKPTYHINNKYSISISSNSLNYPERYFYEVDTDTIGQFTGLYDSYGKEIFEGDIVCFDDTPYCTYGNKYQGVVVEHRGAWCVKHYEEWGDEYFYSPLFADDFASYKTTILGNVYDNPRTIERR